MFSYFACYIFLQPVLDGKCPFERTTLYIYVSVGSLGTLAL